MRRLKRMTTTVVLTLGLAATFALPSVIVGQGQCPQCTTCVEVLGICVGLTSCSSGGSHSCTYVPDDCGCGLQ